jgi:2'-5' RNA ligase
MEPAKQLFFALWPEEAQRNALAEAALEAVKSNGGRPVPALSLHITLTFLGSVPERRLQDLSSVARRAAAIFPSSVAPLTLTLDHIEYWKKARVLCALAERESAQVLALADALTKEAAGAGFNPDLKPFRPHVTLARKVVRPTCSLDIRSAVWSFTEFVLVESRTETQGRVYGVLESYPLVNPRSWRAPSG